MERNELDSQLTWDLRFLFESQTAFEAQLADAEKELKQLCASLQELAVDKAHFISFMEHQETLERYLDNLISYAKMSCDVDPKNMQNQENLASSYTLYQQVQKALSSLPLLLIENKTQIEQWLTEDDCRDFRYPMEEVFRTIPHRLSEDQEALLAQAGELIRNPQETFESFRLSFAPVHVDGKEEFLNDGTYQQFLKNRNPDVRKEAFEHFFTAYKTYENVFMNLLSGHARGQIFEAKLRKFPSALEASLFEDRVDKALFDKVLYMANEKYIDGIHRYFAVRKQVSGLDIQHVYDIQIPLVDTVDISYSIDESFDILKQALAPLGKEYIQLLEQARTERWIDFLPCAGKQGGAYSGGTYDSRPYVLTNFTNDYPSLSTLAHELGHSMHSWYSRHHNRPMLSQYTIFVAEVASTVNEVLLNRYLLDHSDSDKQKAYLLSNLLNQLVGTLYRQPMYAEFEKQLYEMLENGEAVSSQKLTSLYMKLSKDYYGEAVEVDDLQRYHCYHIPHFYYNFYVYKYTLGMSVALSFAKKILAGDTKEYLEFLKKGGSEAPLEELIHAGVDPREDSVYDDAFTFFNKTLDEFCELMKVH
ncbi:oligoendopeptidase F [Erysipelotrichaceae bacterium AF15-26LB]|nr:oligoendopeptidase F [Erysipelotrichaceae bacterium 3_1_53]MCR0347645.1 oligoendopeptidase F [[Clostridium] innocuum]RJV89896.1 oligoendopeptidase F [Erysipelotrichaceae bacterium AF15-26LB]RJV90668.1 oligoendopeptidase F [Erysipelotrichaceae bacterium AF19-24AC]